MPMRQQGRLIQWNDDRGFGFVEPDGGGKQVFVHIRSFVDPKRRPVVNERVSYQLGTDAQGRPCGLDVAVGGESLRAASRTMAENKAFVFTGLFLVVLVGLVIANRLPMVVLGVYLTASLLAIGAYFQDKHAAKRDAWRTPEKTLLLIGLFGGWPGALLAQRLFRHKSSKTSFQILFWGTVIVNCLAVAWFLTPQGGAALGRWISSR